MPIKFAIKYLFAGVLITLFVLVAQQAFAQLNQLTTTLSLGMRGQEVLDLQKFLNLDPETQIADAGAGSAGKETNYFGPATKRAVVKFQEKYKDEILLPYGLKKGTGVSGLKTREKINALSREKTTQSSGVTEKISEAPPAKLIPKEETGLYNVPTRIIIPDINVDAVVEGMGVTPLGAMDSPKGPTTAGWFNLGKRPGEQGSAVISGHYGWKNGIPAVFDNLKKLKTGDKIYVVDAQGTTTVFIVRESRLYDQNADASDVFISSDGNAHLNLITCEGTWNKTEKSYSNRLVVFAEKA
ncbi:MAG: sortase [bacterium]|nr:sortase [bacterium]